VRHSWPFWYPNHHLYAHRMALYHIRQIGLDGHDLTAMVDFWSAALGYELDHRESSYAILRDPADAEPRFFLQQVPEPKVGKNRAHMDVEVPDEGPAVDRLVQLGPAPCGGRTFTRTTGPCWLIPKGTSSASGTSADEGCPRFKCVSIRPAEGRFPVLEPASDLGSGGRI
jgi:catechol 2,3-dioxygenase-like lactoylglutathione lyase family enzyme